jgi:serine/threonine-protein kinase RsbT
MTGAAGGGTTREVTGAATIMSSTSLTIAASEDVVRMRAAVRKAAVAQGMSLVDQTKVITAASELARNALDYGGGGEVEIELVKNGARCGVQLTFSDRGPGIADIELALKDGHTTGGGLGLGLGGAKRLSNEFAIESTPGAGTRVVIVRWRA